MWTLDRPAYPCPFCGGTQLIALSVGSGGFVQCQACGAQGPLGTTQTIAEQYWTTRARALPQRCLRCQGLYVPVLTMQPYCSTACAEAALEKAERAEARLSARWARVATQQAQRERAQAQRKAAQELDRARQRVALAEYRWALVQKEGIAYASQTCTEG